MLRYLKPRLIRIKNKEDSGPSKEDLIADNDEKQN